MGLSDTSVVSTGESLVTILVDAAAELLWPVLSLFGSEQSAALCPIFQQLKHLIPLEAFHGGRVSVGRGVSSEAFSVRFACWLD